MKIANRYIKLYPFYFGLLADLMFYIAIDTLFLSLVKEFSPAEIVSITSLSQVICIALQFPILYLMNKIGNTASVRVGAFCMLASAIFITAGKSYLLVLTGRVFHDVSVVFQNASIVALENNLHLTDRRGEFVRVRTSANTMYSVITMLIAFVASALFNLHRYLPMMGCIACCVVGCILSLLMKDCSSYNKITPKKDQKKQKVKIHYGKIILIALMLYGLFYTTVNSTQSEGKLFMQQQFLLRFDEDNTALIIGAVVCVSRVIRVISNLIFAKLYEKHQSKMGIALPALVGLALSFMLFGSFIPAIVLKIIVMGIGYSLILFTRDPFKVYIQDVVFDHTPPEQHQTLLAVLLFGTKVGVAGTGLIFSAVLLSYPLIAVISLLFALALIETALSIWLYKAVLTHKKNASLSPVDPA